MPCYHPLQAFYSISDFVESGKKRLYFKRKRVTKSSLVSDEREVSIPCGQCLGCRLKRSRDWAVRCVHEASLYDDNCFITLTFDGESLPENWSLDYKVFQDFMKRLRKKFSGSSVVVNEDGDISRPIRFYMCGEYGSKGFRPHFHAILFNFDFVDKKLFKVQCGNNLYVSESLSELWPYGFSLIGDVTFESAAYVARYVMKKVNGEKADKHYSIVNAETGEVLKVSPEFNKMSLRPGIAAGWFEKFSGDVYPSDEVIMKGVKLRPPRYYEKLFEVTDAVGYEILLNDRASKNFKKNSYDRLAVLERCKKKQVSSLVRGL